MIFFVINYRLIKKKKSYILTLNLYILLYCYTELFYVGDAIVLEMAVQS